MAAGKTNFHSCSFFFILKTISFTKIKNFSCNKKRIVDTTFSFCSSRIWILSSKKKKKKSNFFFFYYKKNKKKKKKIKFYKNGRWRVVTIDDRLPCTRGGQLVFARCKDEDEFWVPLMEKAFAKLNGSYIALESGQLV